MSNLKVESDFRRATLGPASTKNDPVYRAGFAFCAILLFSLFGSAAAGRQAGSKSRPVRLVAPNGLALDDRGNLYISDIGTHSVLKLNREGRLIVIAGTGEGGFSGDGGLAVRARLFSPHDIAIDREGNLLIADTFNHRIRRVDRQGVITTVAGTGKAEYSGDHGPAPQASLNNPQSLAVDREGGLLVADTYNYVVRRIDRNGTITTFAGSKQPGFAGDGGAANMAQLSLPMAVAAAPDGSAYISDAGNSRVRRVAPDGKIQTIVGYGAGSGVYGAGFTGDGGPPEKAKVFSATDLEYVVGNLFISDSGNNRIRVIRGSVITTVAGSGHAGFSGDESPAVAAELNVPQKIVIALDGSIFIADRANHRIRKVDTKGYIHTIAGAGKQGAGR